MADEAGEKPRITVIAYSRDKFLSRKVESIKEALSVSGYDVVWVNVDTVSIVPELREALGIHETQMKTLRRASGRARVVVFPDYLFLLLHQVYEIDGGLKRERMGIILKGNLVITIQETPGDVFDPIREGIRKGEGLLREHGADFLLFAILEAIVENYVPIIERISSQMEELEARILSRADEGVLRRIHGIRREILFMRRTIFPLLEAFRKLRLEGGDFFSEDTKPFIDELHDHVLEVLEILEGQRELANSLVELYYSTLSMKTNDIIRILTVVSTIFIPLTFITGLYGMNFRYMPELAWRYSYPAVLMVMLGIALGMLAYFRRKGWI
ncbi:magnesium and cobalt transporter [Thermococcus sp. 4557]|uniref:magnesium/cobalt transporter CorA n=1 Tax=Thermococcus sp. (strain CGMCC 1.5172 / 4557) TaxID=1042877 RepID=UPI000219EBD3|nr:magnesium/cobalt transporter CorA [Thermococcus sp. 4557]AEK72227.1 magnesium and cobalt transporter [Thermococcus sp. 4557]